MALLAVDDDGIAAPLGEHFCQGRIRKQFGAVLIASAPLIYTALEELIKIVWINPLTPP